MTYFTSHLSYHIVWTMNNARKIQIFVKERRPANQQWNKISIWKQVHKRNGEATQGERYLLQLWETNADVKENTIKNIWRWYIRTFIQPWWYLSFMKKKKHSVHINDILGAHVEADLK